MSRHFHHQNNKHLLLTPWIETLVYDSLLNLPWEDDRRQYHDCNENENVIMNQHDVVAVTAVDTTATLTPKHQNRRPKIVQVLAVSKPSSSSSLWTFHITDGTTSIIACIIPPTNIAVVNDDDDDDDSNVDDPNGDYHHDISPGSMLRIQDWELIVAIAQQNSNTPSSSRNGTTTQQRRHHNINNNEHVRHVRHIQNNDHHHHYHHHSLETTDNVLFETYARVHGNNYTATTSTILNVSAIPRKPRLTPTNTSVSTTTSTTPEPSPPLRVVSSIYLRLSSRKDCVVLGTYYNRHPPVYSICPILDTINVRRALIHLEQQRFVRRSKGGGSGDENDDNDDVDGRVEVPTIRRKKMTGGPTPPRVPEIVLPNTTATKTGLENRTERSYNHTPHHFNHQSSLPMGNIESLFNIVKTSSNGNDDTTLRPSTLQNIHSDGEESFWDYIKQIPSSSVLASTTTAAAAAASSFTSLSPPAAHSIDRVPPLPHNGNNSPAATNLSPPSNNTNDSLPLGDIQMLFGPSGNANTETTMNEICQIRNQLLLLYPNISNTTTATILSELNNRHHIKPTAANTTVATATHSLDTLSIPTIPTNDIENRQQSPVEKQMLQIPLPKNNMELTTDEIDDNIRTERKGQSDSPKNHDDENVVVCVDDNNINDDGIDMEGESNIHMNCTTPITHLDDHNPLGLEDPHNDDDVQIIHRKDETDDIGMDNMLIESSDDENDDDDDDDMAAVMPRVEVVDAGPSGLSVSESGGTKPPLVMDALDEKKVMVDEDDQCRNNREGWKDDTFVRGTIVDETPKDHTEEATQHNSNEDIHRSTNHSAGIDKCDKLDDLNPVEIQMDSDDIAEKIPDEPQELTAVDEPVIINVEHQEKDDVAIFEIEDSDDEIEVLATQCLVNCYKANALPEKAPSSDNESINDNAVIMETQFPMDPNTWDVDKRGEEDVEDLHKAIVKDDHVEEDMEQQFETQDMFPSGSDKSDMDTIAKEVPTRHNFVAEPLVTQREAVMKRGIRNSSRMKQDLPSTTLTSATSDVNVPVIPPKRHAETKMMSSRDDEGDNVSLDVLYCTTETDETNIVQTQPNELLVENEHGFAASPVVQSINNVITSTNETKLVDPNIVESKRSKKRRKKEFSFGGDALRSLMSHTT